METIKAKTQAEEIELTRVNNDINGNPRYVCHFLNLVNDKDRAEADRQVNLKSISFGISELYEIALKKSKKIGGRKFHNKQYGGGIVFQSYNTLDLIKSINEIKNS